MTQKEAQDVLNELNNVRIEMLNDEAKRLFDAIMKIADQRDKYKMQLKMMAEEEEKCHKIKDKMIDILINNAIKHMNIYYVTDEELYREIEQKAIKELEDK